MLTVLSQLKQRLCIIKCIQSMSTFLRGIEIIDLLENSIHKIIYKRIYLKIDRRSYHNNFRIKVIQIKNLCLLNT